MPEEHPNRGKPFLRWAGGKNWFVHLLPSILSERHFKQYYEPFLGGGSVFFALQPAKAVLADLNEDLINAYKGVRDDVEGIIQVLSSWEISKEQYYAIRSMAPEELTKQAARFIYLNHTSFNGIWRVNRDGKYNVPYGYRDGYKFNYTHLRHCSTLLQNAQLDVASFETTLKDVPAGSLVFLDPPYTVSHNNNGFIEYNRTLFSLENQISLRQCIDRLNDTGAFYLMTNAAHDTIREIFDGAGDVFLLSRNCALGGKNAKRGIAQELLFTNIPGVELGDD